MSFTLPGLRGSIFTAVMACALFGAGAPAHAGSAGINSYQITATSGAGGSISPSGNIAVATGASLTLQITAEPCDSVLDVVVDGVSQGPRGSYTFTGVSANHTISATFDLLTFSVTPTAGSGGSIIPAEQVILNCAQDQIVTITPADCQEIADVLVDGLSVGPVPTYTFANLLADHTISATFQPIHYTIATSSGSNGSIAPGGNVGFNCGDQQTFSIIPDLCHSVVAVLVDGVSVGAVTTYAFNNVRANHTLSATFAIDSFTVVASAGQGGTLSPEFSTVANCGSNVAYTITPNACYSIADVLVDGVSIGAEPTYTLTNIQANHTIAASFALRSYKIIATAGVNGTIGPADTVTVTCGQNQSFAITPDACYSIASLSIDGLPVTPTALYSFTNVMANHTIAATFIAGFHVVASAGTGGSISPGGDLGLNCGDNQSFTITPDACDSIANVLVDGVSVGAVTSYGFLNLQANHTIAASFTSTGPPTTTTLAPTPSPSVCQQAVTLHANIAPSNATGSVEFFEGVTSLGTAAVSAGAAALAPAVYSVGQHVFTAVFTPSGCFAGSSALPDTHTVNPAPLTSGVLGTDVGSAVWAQPVTFTATLTPSAATGTVTFKDSLTTLGTAALSGGVAQITRSNLTVGYHGHLSATYNGDACYAAGFTAPSASLLVGRAPTTIGLTSDLNPAPFAGKVNLTATLSPAGSTGQVKFYDGGNLFGTANLNSLTGVATLSISNLVVGAHNLTLSFNGDTHFAPSTSAGPYVQNITMATTSVALSSDVTPSKYGQVITLTASMTPGNVVGMVEFFDGIHSLGTAPVGIGGNATLTLDTLSEGSHSLTASFGDGTNYQASVSAVWTQVVTPDQAPVVTVIAPNGGEAFNLGNNITISWIATDNTSVNSIKIELSRNNGANWETLVSGLPNVGSWDWNAVGSGTNPDTVHVYSALVRVTAADNVAVEGSDVSDAPFSLFDLQTAVVLTRLDAVTLDDGVSISWTLSNRGIFSSLALQRSPAEAGPWNAVDAQVSDNAGVTVAVDHSALAGQSYYYRLVGTTSNGTQAVFGPVRGTAGAPKSFGLSAAWPNPSRGPLTLQFTVPRLSHIKLSVVDLQGREVAVLARGEQSAGRYQVNWDGRTDKGAVQPGLYFVRFSTPEKQIVNRVTIAR